MQEIADWLTRKPRYGVISTLLAVLSYTSSSANAAQPEPAEFATCLMCHDASENGVALVGPPLWGVNGRKAGTVPGYPYSTAMAGFGAKWDRPLLIAFITAPQSVVPGTKMGYGGQRDSSVAAQLADYVLSLR